VTSVDTLEMGLMGQFEARKGVGRFIQILSILI